jgi:hypothetical protein
MTTTLTVNVVEDAPTASPPIVLFMPGVRMENTALVARVSWPPATDPTSSIAGYEVQFSRTGGPWSVSTSLPSAKRDVVRGFLFDSAYRVRLRAVDSAGNCSPWVETPILIHPIDDRSAAVVRHGTWQRASSTSAWRSTVTGSSKAGATLTMAFTGHAVAIVGPTNPHRGKVKVFIDGVYIRTVNMRSVAWTSRHIVFTANFAKGGTHRIDFQAVGTGTYPLVRLDAFVVSK